MTATITPPAPGRVWLLRTCNADGTSYGGFRWPLTPGALVEAPDWNPAPECGNGLHGLLWGQGKAGLLSHASDAAWLIVEADAADVVDLSSKVKVPRCTVVAVGGRDAICQAIQDVHPGCYRGTATAGRHGTATAGYSGTATAGYSGTLVIKWHDGKRYRIAVGYVGEDGILPNVAYKLDARGKFVRA